MDDAERSAIAFLRTARNGRRLVCVCNFTPVRYDDFVIGLPRRGVLRELLSSDSEEFGGSGVHNAPEIRSENVPFGTLPCSARVTLPVNAELGTPEHHEWRWVTYDEAQDLVSPRVAPVLEWARAVVLGVTSGAAPND